MSITALAETHYDWASKSTPRQVGPGTYEPNFQNTPEETIFPFSSTTRRELWNIPDAPNIGPGCYEPKKRAKSNISTIPMDRNNRDYFKDYRNTPSPADHSVITEWGKKKPATGMTNRPPRYQRDNLYIPELIITPGPGEYNTNTDGPSKGTSFGKSLSPQRIPERYNGIPGPGKYGKIETHIPNRPSPAFKTKSRGELFHAAEYDATMIGHVAWTVEENELRPFNCNSKRELQFFIPDTPGPDVYTARKPKKQPKQQAQAFGSSREFYDYAMNDNPGPGYYGEEKPRKTRPSSANKAQKKDMWTSGFITPSAPDYDITRTGFAEKKIKMRTPNPQFKGEPVLRDCLTNREPNPGPAFYVKVSKKNKQTIPKRTRFKEGEYISGIKMSQNPAPTDYDATIGKEKKTKGGVIRRNARFDPKDRTPKVSPASYQNNNCDMIKPSYNVRFDPALKKSNKYRT
ncbi:hypothetical protein TRFO_11010 [Tritrichomonas foetus]|uniref:Uncharacterized protein n=1 Tax=Tritrichomonas foetus TaxID=1144522 RepID=A0A1J4J5X1_9EUKA|nr:hypothetical protein TRFO_11010 [Tritrichomonas foetus]|eukprot:OHS94626.1 hypothetical protein TRFO_11010 [Tritrichomonas foetus]